MGDTHARPYAGKLMHLSHRSIVYMLFENISPKCLINPGALPLLSAKFKLCQLVYLHACIHTAAVTVYYSVNYQEGPCMDNSPPIPSINVSIPCGGTAQQVMENAVNYPDPDVARMYRFAATYFGSSLGYFVNAINSIPPIIEPLTNESCFWLFLLQTPNGTLLSSNVGISSYTFNSDGYGMIMRYTAPTETIGNGTTESTSGICNESTTGSGISNGAPGSTTVDLKFITIGLVLTNMVYFLLLNQIQ